MDVSSAMGTPVNYLSTLAQQEVVKSEAIDMDIEDSNNEKYAATTTSFDLAKKFIQNDLSDKMIRNLKTNYSQLILSTFIPDSNPSCSAYENSGETSEKSAGTAVINEDPISPPSFDFLKYVGFVKLDDPSFYDFPDDKIGYPRFYVNIIKSIERMNNFIKKKKFPFREIHLFSSFDDFKDAQEMDHPLKNAIMDQLDKNDIILKIYDVSNDNSMKSSSTSTLLSTMKNKEIIMEHFQLFQRELPNNVAIYSLQDCCNLLSTPKLKNVTPVRILLQYQLRFFTNPAKNTLISILKKKIALSKSSSSVTDDLDLNNEDSDEKIKELQSRLDSLTPVSSESNSFDFCIEVDGFKAIKQDHPMSQSLFQKDVLTSDGSKNISDYNIVSSRTNVVYIKKPPEKIEKIKQEKIRRIQNLKNETTDVEVLSMQEKEEEIVKDDEDIDFYDVKPLNSDQCQPTFKYANRYLPVSSELYKKMEYVSLPGFDFRGIMKLKDLPPWYLMTEPIFLFPTKNIIEISDPQYSLDRLVIFNSLVGLLLDMESIIIARYCKNDTYIRMVALIPVIVRDSDDITLKSIRSLGSDDPNRVFAFIMNELPFKEDEKTMSGGSFTKLDVIYGENGEVIADDPKYLPDEHIQTAMDLYIESMDMDDDNQGSKVNLSEFSSEFVATGYTSHNIDMNLDIDSLLVDDRLMQLLPSAHITTYYLKKVATEAANHNKIPTRFVADQASKNMLNYDDDTDPISKKFFDNFRRNSRVDHRLAERSRDALKALKDVLDVTALDPSLEGAKASVQGSKFNVEKSGSARKSNYRRGLTGNADEDGNSDSDIEEVNLDEDLDLDDILGL